MGEATVQPTETGIGRGAQRRLAGFVRTLRDNGYPVGLGEAQDALRVMASAAADRPETLRSAFKALFCSRRDDWMRFDEIFAAYWRGRGVRSAVRTAGSSPSGAASLDRWRSGDWPGGGRETRSGVQREEQPGDGAHPGGAARHEGASAAESLSEIDLRHVADPAAMAEAQALAERLARAMRYRLTRRQRRRPSGRAIDLRRTIRASIGRGGTPIDLVRRRRKDKPLRLVLLLDVSGSMNLYAPFFVRFMRGLIGSAGEADAYVFHTRLVHIAEALRETEPTRAVERLSLMAQGWSGGTRIGDSLAVFNRWHAARAVRSRTVVIIVSDGYDTGAPERLGAEMAALHRRARRIVWLNPLLGREGYEPLAGGMRAALPHVDLFAAAHNLASLAALEPYLAQL
jgi:uncharacterized protein with von Willebrand factor type A (vWA) domain